MLRWFRKSRKLVVEFCERCGRVCDAVSRAAAARDRALNSRLHVGGRF